jgi:type IV secretory pathway VirB10-like protein
MKSRILLSLLFIVCMAVRVRADDDADAAAKKKLEDAIRARLAEHARKQATGSMLEDSPPPPTAPVDPAAKPVAPATPAPAPADAAKPKEEPVTMMPKFEVKREKITELQIQIQEKDKEIAREKKKLKSTDLDQTLNNPKIANNLSILGGKSTDVTESLASQRVTLLEAERDTLEAMTQARTQAEKDELQNQLEELADMRRDLDSPPEDHEVGLERK